MPKLIFFSRLALLCNLCYLAGILLRMYTAIVPHFISSTVLILGYPVSITLNTILFFVYLFQLFRKNLFRDHPVWLIIFNNVIFIVQTLDLLT